MKWSKLFTREWNVSSLHTRTGVPGIHIHQHTDTPLYKPQWTKTSEKRQSRVSDSLPPSSTLSLPLISQCQRAKNSLTFPWHVTNNLAWRRPQSALLYLPIPRPHTTLSQPFPSHINDRWWRQTDWLSRRHTATSSPRLVFESVPRLHTDSLIKKLFSQVGKHLFFSFNFGNDLSTERERGEVCHVLRQVWNSPANYQWLVRGYQHLISHNTQANYFMAY